MLFNTFVNCKKLISIVLGSFNRLNFLKLTINNIRQEVKDLSYEIIVIDGGSDDGTLGWLVEQKDVITIVQHNRGFWCGSMIKRRSWGYFMNLGFKCSQGKYICMLSDDCLIVPGAIINGINLFESMLSKGEKIGAVAFYWRNWSQEEHYHVNLTLGNKMYVNHGMYLNNVLKEVDYIDEENFFFYNGDGDLCLKIWQAGYACIDSPNSFVEHYPHANLNVRRSNYKLFKKDLKNYLKKWEGIFYDKFQDCRGGGISKYYVDKTKTGDQFSLLHQQILIEDPRIMFTKPAYKKLAEKIYWKYRAFVRKVRNMVRI